MSSFLTCGLCAPRTPVSEGKTIAEPVTSPVVVPKVKFLEQMARLPCFSNLAHMVQLPGQCCSQPVCNSGRPSDCRRDHILRHTRSPRKYILAPPKLGTRPRLMKTCQLHPSSAAVLSTVLVSSMQLSGIIVTLQRSQSWASNIFHHCRYCRRKGFNYPFIKQSPSTLTSVSCFLGFVLYHSSLPASCQENREGGLI